MNIQSSFWCVVFDSDCFWLFCSLHGDMLCPRDGSVRQSCPALLLIGRIWGLHAGVMNVFVCFIACLVMVIWKCLTKIWETETLFIQSLGAFHACVDPFAFSLVFDPAPVKVFGCTHPTHTHNTHTFSPHLPTFLTPLQRRHVVGGCVCCVSVLTLWMSPPTSAKFFPRHERGPRAKGK